jgi:tRNA 2-thiouridine synthesizing protein A
MNFDNQVDASGLSCPLPILRAKKALATMSTGQVLRVVATDPGSVRDFEAFARQTGNELIKSGEVGEGAFEFFLRRAER